MLHLAELVGLEVVVLLEVQHLQVAQEGHEVVDP
jgi:hypothetical protein